VIYPLNPKAARAFRDRKAPSGTKSDHLDAWSFADALRVDVSNWKPLLAQDLLLEQLRHTRRHALGIERRRSMRVSLSTVFQVKRAMVITKGNIGSAHETENTARLVSVWKLTRLGSVRLL